MLTAWGARRTVFDSVGVGLSGTPEGGQFRVQQANGRGAYVYNVVGGAASFVDVVPINGAILTIRSAEALCSSPISDLVVHAWGTNGYEWDGRVVPNEKAATDPTLNLIPDPFNPVDEDGGSTPARTINDATITDPDGGHNAMRSVATAQNQQNAFTNISDDVLPTDNYVVRAQFQTQAGGTAWRIGGVSTNTTSFTADGNWTVRSVSLTGFANAVALGFSSAPGNTDGEIGVYNCQMFDPLAGTVYPSTTAEKAACAFHAKRPAAYKQSLAFDQYYALDTTTETDGVNLIGPPDRVTKGSYAFGCWVNCTSEPTSTSGIALGFDFHTGGATGPLHGQVGVVANNGTGYDRFGMPYFAPGLSLTVSKTGHYLVNEGWQHLAMSVDAGTATYYINSVPCNSAAVAGITDAVYSKLLLASYQGISRRRKVLQHLPGYLQGWWFIDRAITQEEMTAQDLHGRQRFAAIGDPRLGPRKMCLIGCNDSRTAFGPSPFWHLTQNRSFSPRLHAHCEAVGGTNLDDWVADPRKAFLKRQIAAASDAGYTKILLLQQPGTNELLWWYQHNYHTTGGLTEWLVDYKAYLAELRAQASGKVYIVGMTLLPCPTTFSTAYSAGDLAAEQIRYTFNDMAVNNPSDVGWDYTIDSGRGTERIDGSGNIGAESIGGGSAMGNYRVAAGCMTGTSSPAATITLSALSGSSFTATASAGTFNSQHVGRKITAGTGAADITAVNGAGSVATLSTAGFAPTPYTNEPAGSVTRDTITRTAFDALSYTSGNWSIVAGGTWYLTDGLHYSEPGGRFICDNYLAAYLQAYQASL